MPNINTKIVAYSVRIVAYSVGAVLLEGHVFFLIGRGPCRPY